MTENIEPGQGVAVFRLPMPLTGMPYIADAIARIYGEGDTMLSFNGNQIQVNAPEDGFGPVLTKGKRPKPPKPGDGDLVWLEVRDGLVKFTLEDLEDRVKIIAHTMMLWFTQFEGINYVEHEIITPDFDNPFIFTLQLKDGLTPAQKATAAEQKLAELTTSTPVITDAMVDRAAHKMFEPDGSAGEYTWAEMIREDPSRADLWRQEARSVLTAALAENGAS